jgi:hypothetical protein
VIVAWGSILRFFNLFELPLTHDEFSTLFRTNFSSFDELIEKGVKVDAHPAGLQVFVYYYKSIFGTKEWVLKIPFLIFGVGSIVLIYNLFSKWYNNTLGLISAAYLATLQYFVMYSQIARPYSSGLFFILLLIYLWNKIILSGENHWRNYVFYGLTTALCFYNHHFSALLAGIISITGIVLSDSKQRFKIIITGIFITLLYVPHLSILFAQLKLKGLSEWLNPPDISFISNYFSYVFQFSYLAAFTIISLLTLSIITFQKKHYFSKITIVNFVWFTLPFTIGFLYSIYIAPVLQYSVLIFSMPFLFPLLLGGIKEQKLIIKWILVVGVLTINTYSLVKERKHFELFYTSFYKKSKEDGVQLNPKTTNYLIDGENIHKKILNHYLSKNAIKNKIIWADQFKDYSSFIQFLQSNKKDYFYYSAVFDADPNLIPLILDYYPEIIFQKNYYSGTNYLFKKSNIKPNNSSYYEKFKHSINNISFSIDAEYSKNYVIKLSEIIPQPTNFIDISLEINELYTGNPNLVSVIQDGDSTIDWRGMNLDSQNNNLENHKIKIHLPIKMSDIPSNKKNLMFNTYVWKKKGEKLNILNYIIQIRKGNPLIYGMFYPI